MASRLLRRERGIFTFPFLILVYLLWFGFLLRENHGIVNGMGQSGVLMRLRACGEIGITGLLDRGVSWER